MKAWLVFALGCGASPGSPPHNSSPAEPTTLELTWVVHPPVETSEYPGAYPLDLLVGTKRITLEQQMGSLHAYYQSMCLTEPNSFGLGRDEVAKITFEEGGFGGYLVRRSPRGLDLISWGLSDGLCNNPAGEPIECPRHDTLVQTLDVPAGIKVVQKLIVIDKAGKQTPFDCTGEETRE